MKVVPLNDKIVVKRLEAEEKTAGGIVLPDTAKEKPRQGKVLSLGEGKLMDNGKRAAFQVKEGDRVLFTSYAGNEVTIDGQELITMNGEDVAGLIRMAEITAASGPIASSPVVRRRLVELQREAARGRDIVCEGRDQGTVVFPDAACKFYLDADPPERARRRHREMLARGEAITLEEVLRAQEARDARDAARDLAPMVPAADAVRLDSTGLSPEEV